MRGRVSPWKRARRRRRTGPSRGAVALSHCTTKSTRKVRPTCRPPASLHGPQTPLPPCTGGCPGQASSAYSSVQWEAQAGPAPSGGCDEQVWEGRQGRAQTRAHAHTPALAHLWLPAWLTEETADPATSRLPDPAGAGEGPQPTAASLPGPVRPRPARLKLAFPVRLSSLDISSACGVSSLAQAGPLSHTEGQVSPRLLPWPPAAASLSRLFLGQESWASSTERCLPFPQPAFSFSPLGFFLHDYLCSWILFLTTRAHECFNRA